MRKRILCVLTGLVLFFCGFTVPVRAEAADTLYDLSLIIGYDELTPGQQQVFLKIYDAIRRHEESVSVTFKMKDADAISDLIQQTPELFYGRIQSFQYYKGSDEYNGVVFQYTGTASEDEKRFRAMMEIADNLVQSATGSSYDKELLFNDFICDRVTYDYAALRKADMGNATTAYGALVEGKAVCQGYSNALILLLRMAGIPCGLVSGTGKSGESHAWVGLKLGNVLCLTDPTWNDPEDQPNHHYFNLSEEQLSHNHVTTRGGIVGTTDELEYYRVNGQLAPDTKGEVWPYIENRVRNAEPGEREIDVRFNNREAFVYLQENFEEWAQRIFDLGVQSISYMFDEDQWIFRMEFD